MKTLVGLATQRLLWLCQDWSHARGQIGDIQRDPSPEGMQRRMQESAQRAAERKEQLRE